MYRINLTAALKYYCLKISFFGSVIINQLLYEKRFQS